MTLVLGEPVPDFTLRDQHGVDVSLASFRGNKVAVLMFYPHAFSSVCTDELTAVRDDLATFQSDAVQLLAVSCDSMYTLRVLADRDGLTFPLLSDFWPHGAVATAYGAFDPVSGSAERSTFIVDKEGRLRWTVQNPRPEARDLREQARVIAGLT